VAGCGGISAHPLARQSERRGRPPQLVLRARHELESPAERKQRCDPDRKAGRPGAKADEPLDAHVASVSL
jgi:hypothetical protein